MKDSTQKTQIKKDTESLSILEMIAGKGTQKRLGIR